MKIKLFATLKDRARASEIAVRTGGPLTVRELRQIVASQFPALANLMPQTLVAVNQQFAFNEDTVQDTDEVALFPPVSGGAPEYGTPRHPTLLRITPDPIDLNELQRAITTEYDG